MDIKYTILLIALLNFIIGFFVLSKNRKSTVNLSFALVSFDLGFWAVSMFFYVKPLVFDSETWIKIVYLFVIGLAVIWTYFFKIFLEVKDKIFPISITLVAFFFIYILINTDYWVKEVITKPWGPETILGPAYGLFGIYILITIGWVVYYWVKKILQSRGIQKIQLLYVFAGGFIYSILATIFDVVLPLITGNSRFFWISTYFSLFFVGATGYAIIKYRLMDIRFVLGRGAVYAFSLIAIIWLAFLLMASGNKFLPAISFNITGPLILIISILLFQPIFNFFEKLASKYFYYTFYSYQTVLTDLGKGLTRFLDLDQLSSLIVSTLMNTMKLDRTVILLREPGDGEYVIQKNIGFREENGISLVKDNFLTIWLERTQMPLVYEELSLIIRDTGKGEMKIRLENLKENMKGIEAALCLPLLLENKIIGMIVLGNKLSGEPYSQQDIELLTTLSNQASMALQNAKSYSEIKNFSIRLEREVEKATKELREAYEELKNLDKAKSEFISIASHQLRTPLTAIKGYISMMREKIYGIPPKQMEKPLKNIYASNERLIKLVNDLLSVSRIEAGRMEMELEKLSLEEIISSVVEELKNIVKEKNIYLKWEKLKKPLPKISVDREKIRQVILNVVDNAIRYTEKGGVTIKCKMENEKCKIEVSDTGAGLTKYELSKIFESFSRGAAGTRLYTEGVGLGLYIAKRFVEMHKGKIWAESKGKGKGSTFCIELPLSR